MGDLRSGREGSFTAGSRKDPGRVSEVEEEANYKR